METVKLEIISKLELFNSSKDNCNAKVLYSFGYYDKDEDGSIPKYKNFLLEGYLQIDETEDERYYSIQFICEKNNIDKEFFKQIFPVYKKEHYNILFNKEPLEFTVIYKDDLEHNSYNNYCLLETKIFSNNYDSGQFTLLELDGNKNMSSLKNKIKKIIRKEPEKTFVEVGFMDDNEEITSEGLEALNYILWNDKKDELKKLADKVKEEK